MASRKPSAKAKQLEAFKSQLGDMDELFAREDRRREDISAQREASLRNKACESKNCYPSRAEAEEAIRACEAHGKRGLHSYRCKYCNGWHLSSKPLRKD